MTEPTNQPKKERTRIFQTLDTDLHREIKSRAAKKGVTLQAFIEELLRQAIESQKPGEFAAAG